MNNVNQNVEFLQNQETKPKQTIKKPGILVYQEAKVKLQISNNGKIYKQKGMSYVPFIGPLFSLVYANLCVGKTRCLKSVDSKLFKSAGRKLNWFGWIFWPIIFLGMWALLQYLLMDFSGAANATGSYAKLWTDTINVWDSQIKLMKLPNGTTVTSVLSFISSIFTLLSNIFISPVISMTPIMIEKTAIPSNLFFIVSFLIFTMINPVNIVNSIVLNSKKRRFIVVHEVSSVNQYR